ncbi:MAG: hypothetical protein LBS11_05515 [Oscillospiraceae bacterium]|jgi:hypothetical protein|nr:hypothetical protein [Oscillospiraceae bacterium]
MVIGINYANGVCRPEQMYSATTARKRGQFDKFIEYSPKDLDENFVRANANILNKPRGGGYWLWKPYVILKTLEQANDGDYVFYADCDKYYTGSIRPLIKCMADQGRDIMLFSQDFFEYAYTKRDILDFFGVVGNPKFTETRQFLGGFQCYRKSEHSMEFVEKLLENSTTGDLITDAKSVTGSEDRRFIQTRRDQSILSIQAKAYGIQPHRRPEKPPGKELPGDAPSPYGEFMDTKRLRGSAVIAKRLCARVR